MILKARVAQLAIMYFAVNGTARARRMRFCAFFLQRLTNIREKYKIKAS